MSSTRILMFHRVLDDVCTAFGLPSCYRMRGTSLTPAELEHALVAFGPILRLDEVEQALELGHEIPIGAVLTFDDGYREHIDVVANLLACHGHTATFFIATGLDGTGTVAAVDAWYWLLDHAIKRTARVPTPCGGIYEGRIDSLEGKQVWVSGEPKKAFLAVTGHTQTEMLRALAESVGVSLPADLAEQLYMGPSDWSKLVDLGMRLGAHSVSHPLMPQLDPTRLHIEVSESVEMIRRLNHPVTFAYPNGDHSQRVVRELRRTSVSSALTCKPGPIHRRIDVMQLPREFITPDSLLNLQTMASL